jgi:hypothetical protein
MPSPLVRRTVYSFLLGFAIFLLGAALEMFLRSRNITGLWLFIDNCAVGIITGLVVFWYERQRYKSMTKQIRIIAAMNHHVRNALQRIMYVPYSTSQAEQIKTVHESVDRIQWALREILPGRDTEEHPAFPSGLEPQKGRQDAD